MSDVPGLLADPKDPASLISTLRVGEVDGLKKRGVIDKGMRPKIASAVRALQEGVQRVHFVDGRMPHSLLLEIFTDVMSKEKFDARHSWAIDLETSVLQLSGSSPL